LARTVLSAVGIGEAQPDLVFGVRPDVEDAAGVFILPRESGSGSLPAVIGGNAFEGQCLVPSGLAGPAILDGRHAVEVVVPLDLPLDA
jgi:hypothetical protein